MEMFGLNKLAYCVQSLSFPAKGLEYSNLKIFRNFGIFEFSSFQNLGCLGAELSKITVIANLNQIKYENLPY